MLPLMIVFRPWFVTPALPPNVPNCAAEPRAMTGGVGGTAQLATVKVQILSATMSLAGTARSTAPFAPLRIRAVYTPTVSGALGVKVAMCPVAGSSTTEDAVTGAAPVTVKTPELIELGFICRPEGTLNVALTVAVGHIAAAP